MSDCILCFYFQTVMTTAQSWRPRAGMTINNHHYNRTIRLEKIIQTSSTANGNVLIYDRRQKKSLEFLERVYHR